MNTKIVRLLTRVSATTKRVSNKLLAYAQKLCKHRRLGYMGDAHDFKYYCPNCHKEWFDEVPRITSICTHGGKTYLLDGKGDVSEAA